MSGRPEELILIDAEDLNNNAVMAYQRSSEDLPASLLDSPYTSIKETRRRFEANRSVGNLDYKLQSLVVLRA